MYALFVAIVTGTVLGGQVFAQKCGTPAILERIYQVKKMHQPKPQLLPPSLSDSTISPSGKFMIHYDREGTAASTADYVRAVTGFADEAYQLEVVELGYPKPAFSFADSMWHIYLVNMDRGYYGATVPVEGSNLGTSPTGLERSASFIQMDHEYSDTNGYSTTGLDAARITIFHEFHHIIQHADYGVDFSSQGKQTESVKLQEMTSTWMEVRSTPNVKDYIQYIPAYFKTIDFTFMSAGDQGYSQATWLYFMSRRFGDGVVKGVWIYYADSLNDVLSSIANSIQVRNSDFCNEYKRFGAEIFFTGRRFRGSSIFPDAPLFPVDVLKYNKLALGITMVNDIVFPASLQLNAAGSGADTSVVSIARNTDRSSLSADTLTIIDLATYRASYQIPETFCDTIVGGKVTDAIVFPEPYLIIENTKADPLHIRAKNSQPVSDPRLTIYTTSFSLIRHIEAPASPVLGGYYMDWDGTDDHGKTVSSGVYLYNIEVDGEKRAGKFVVVRKQ